MPSEYDSQSSTVSGHQALVANLLKTAHNEIYGISNRPDFVREISLKPIEQQRTDIEVMGELSLQLISDIPELFEQYSRDCRLLERSTGEAKILGVTFDKNEDEITGQPVTRKDRVTTGHDSLGRRYNVVVTATMDLTPFIKRIMASVSELGVPEYVYIMDIRMTNITYDQDPHGYYKGAEGATVIKVLVDPLYDQIFTEIQGGYPVNRPQPLRAALDVLRSSLPKIST